MSMTRGRQMCVAMVLSVLTGAGARAQTNAAGWTFTLKFSIDSGNGRVISREMSEQIRGTKLRLETHSDVTPSSIAGSYSIMDDRDGSMTTVMPTRRQATISIVGPIMAGGSMKRTIETHYSKREIVDLGSGTPLLGHATHRYRVTTVGTADITSFGLTCTQVVNLESEMWIAPGLNTTAFTDALLEHFGVTNVSDFISYVGQTDTKLPKGAVLRSVTKSTANDAQGAPKVTTTTMEILELSDAPIADSVFAIPAGYHITDMRQRSGRVTGTVNFDSAARASLARRPGVVCRPAGKKP